MKTKMVKYNLVADVSSHQPNTLAFFKELKAKGVKAVIIKLTEGSRDGSNYINPKAKRQKANAEKAGLLVHAYHYAKYNGVKDAQNEADFFTSVAKKLGFSKNSVLADDVEDHTQKKDCTEDTKAFLNRVKKNGFPNVDLYTMASWIWAKRINLSKIGKINLWIANYGVSQPNVDNVGTWQYTNKFPILGKRIDMSYDFNGYYTKATTASKILDLHPLVKYDCAGAVVVTAANGAYTYKSKELKDKVKDITTKQYTTLELLAVEGGAYKVAGGYIDGRAAVAKLNPLKDNPHKSGKCVVMQANTHILKTPAADAKKGAELEKGTVLKFNGRVGRFLKLANGAGYVTGNRAYIRL